MRNWRPRSRRDERLRLWHRRLGIAAFAFITWLAASGTLLSRSETFGLDQVNVDWPWLMRLYGLHAEPPQQGFISGAHWLARTERATLLDGAVLTPPLPAPIGFVGAGTQWVVATAESLVLLRADGARIDELRSPLLPLSHLRRIGQISGDDHSIVVQDLDAYASRDGGDHWQALAGETVQWSQPVALSAAQQQQTLAYARPQVRLEQLLIDLHSGRLFGGVGAWAITVTGLFALLLAPSGFLVWLRQRRRRKRARGAPMQPL